MNLKVMLTLWLLLSQILPGIGQVKNTMLGEMTTTPGARAIAINPRHPENIVAVAGQGAVYVTRDGGTSWKSVAIPPGKGEPALFAGGKGTFYYLCVEAGDTPGLIIRTSDDGGETWSAGEPVANRPVNVREQWGACDGRGNMYVTWTQFDGDDEENCRSGVFFSMSKNGKKWSEPVAIAADLGRCVSDAPVGAAIPAVTYDGKVMIAWSGDDKILLDRSFNGGGWWLSNDILVSALNEGMNLSIPGLGSLGATPVLLSDVSKGSFRGSLYIVWADQRKGPDDTDVWFTRSHNFGDNWSSPMRINTDGPGKHQYMPWMAIDQTTGYIYIMYYDRRDHDDDSTDVYLAWSTNGGGAFSEILLSETPFIPREDQHLGMRNGITAHGGVIAPVWTRVDGDEVSVWTAIVKHEDLPKP